MDIARISAALEPKLFIKYEKLKDLISEYGSLLVAFSGGVDSALLLKVATDVLGSRCIGALALSPAYDEDESAAALLTAREMGAAVITIRSSEMENTQYTANTPERCYFCKEDLFRHLEPIAREHGVSAIAYGVNSSDMGDYRPGQRSAKERGIKTPLLDAGFTKEDIRALAKFLDLSVWDKPSLACFSSRIPYGSAIRIETLQQISAAEKFLRSLGFIQVRVRHHDTIARIEVPEEDIARMLQPETRHAIESKLRSLGYVYVTLDLRGYRTGSMNDTLNQTSK